MDLLSFTSEYAIRQDVSAGHAEQLRITVRQFGMRLGREAQLTDLTVAAINGYLGQLREGFAAETRRSRRRILLTLADDAARLGLIAPINRAMIAKVKARPALPCGLTWEEARGVLTAVNHLGGPQERWLRFKYRKTGITRRAWWRAYLASCWDTGAPADLRQLRWDEIREGGFVWKLRGKTAKPLRWQLSEYALLAIEQIREPVRELVFPLPGTLGLFRREAKFILETVAGLKGQTLGGYRSGAGSDAELRHGRGAGSALLGNSPAVFARYYALPVVGGDVQAPKPLMGKECVR